MSNTFYKHTIWDWNGTLINDATVSYLLCLKELELCGVPAIPPDEYKRKFHHPMKDFYTEVGVDFSKRSYLEITDHFHNSYVECLPECKIFDDALPILTTLQSWGLSQSILSALPHDILIKSVTEKGLGSFFTDVQGLHSNAADSKVANGQKWFNDNDFSASEILLVGDTAHDKEVADVLGIDCILVSRGCQHHDNLIKLGCPVFNSLASVKVYLQGMRSATLVLAQNAS
ncbi:MAG: HAD family hydrolase [Bdellovibrionota bacterium]